MKETLLVIAGVICIGWVLFHVMFWKIFDWKSSLKSLSHQQRSIMYISNIMMIYILLAFAYLSIVYGTVLLASFPGKIILCGIGLFWLIRAVLQVFLGFPEKEAVRRSIVIIIACVVMALFYFVPLYI